MPPHRDITKDEVTMPGLPSIQRIILMICSTTRPQREAILRLFKRNPDGSQDYRHFRRRVTRSLDWIGVSIGGVYHGIEKDGYVHT